MSHVLTQVSVRRGTVARVPISHGTPVIELYLSPQAYIVDFEIKDVHLFDTTDRKTRDWAWKAVVAHPLP